MKIGSNRKECTVDNVEITKDTLSSWGGLNFVMRIFMPLIYLRSKFDDTQVFIFGVVPTGCCIGSMPKF